MSSSFTISHQTTYNDHDVYDVTFSGHSIQASVTSSSSFVASWIRRIESIHNYRLRNLVVGLDVEWRPNTSRHRPPNPVTVLQVCVGHLCLVFKLRYADALPQELADFLGDEDYTFVGVGIEDDAQKLYDDFGLEVSNTVDLRNLASTRLDKALYNWGLAALANEVLDMEYTKSKAITMSDWSQPVLSLEQVAYAAVDAFLSFEIGKCLKAAHF